MLKIKKMMSKLVLGAMTVTTLLATSAGASAATTATVTATPVNPAVTATVKLKAQPVGELQPTKIHLKRVTTKQISSEVQTNIDASALSLDQKHQTSQLTSQLK